MTSAALVLLMVPGLALFYGGMVRSKNVLNMLNMNFYCLGIVPIIWAVVGMSIANGDSDRKWLGFFEFGEVWMQQPDGAEPRDMATWAFLLTFAVITPALISGAVADRMKFTAWMIFVPVWSILVYSPVGFWIYGGWAHALPAYDTAGGTAIHINAGAAALAMAIVLGKRRNWGKEAWPPHNLPFVLLGTGMLWFGWFGFNSG
ncbi:ammonium transporter, partial [bacterium]|nr:ammonium transporter [bacterium]